MSVRTAPLRVAIVGAECTGKTTLATALAERLPAIRVPERLREFCEERGRTPTAAEQPGLVREQLAREADAVERAARAGLAWVLLDSTPLVTALYSVEIFGDDALVEAAVAHQRGYALTLCTDIDVAWQADGIQRDGPAARAAFHARLRDALRVHAVPHHLVRGDAKTRLASAHSRLLALHRVKSEIR